MCFTDFNLFTLQSNPLRFLILTEKSGTRGIGKPSDLLQISQLAGGGAEIRTQAFGLQRVFLAAVHEASLRRALLAAEGTGAGGGDERTWAHQWKAGAGVPLSVVDAVYSL